jgi:hypothetical protein
MEKKIFKMDGWIGRRVLKNIGLVCRVVALPMGSGSVGGEIYAIHPLSLDIFPHLPYPDGPGNIRAPSTILPWYTLPAHTILQTPRNQAG